MTNSDMLGVLAVDAVVLAVALCFPGFRQLLRDILLGARALYVETPLRLVTGRRRPDHAAIAQMERELLPHPERSEP